MVRVVPCPLAAVLVVDTGGSLGWRVGFAGGEPIRRHILRAGVHTVTDSVAGAAVSIVAVLAMCWFLGLTFSRGPGEEIAQQIQRSAVLQTLDQRAPKAPGFLASVQGILAGVSFPPVFPGLEPALPSRFPLPPSVDTPWITHAPPAVVKVSGLAC